MRSNDIDAGNSLQQNELKLEKHWLTKDCWFRIDTTVIGICVTGSYCAAQYQVPLGAGIAKMSVQNYAMHAVYDLWNWKVSMELKLVVAAAPGLLPPPTNITTPSNQGVGVQLGPPSLESVMMQHIFGYTAQRKGSHGKKGTGQIFRHACQMNALNFEKKDITIECQHPECMRRERAAKNRWGPTLAHSYAITQHVN